jgi:anhydro-N-acetylmuramic acid kinase
VENWPNAVDTSLFCTFKVKLISRLMHPNIKNLYTIAHKPTRKVIGLMSGTSMDGLDIALCEIAGAGSSTALKLIQATTLGYNEETKENILSVISKENVSLEKLCLINPWLGKLHAKMILETLDIWKIAPSEIDLIASHGQTIYHAPKTLHPNDTFGSATLQIGEADHIAVDTGIITISDFRQKHIAAGGEGAPLSVYGDYILFASKTENRILLNIGGISNFTYLPAGADLNTILSSDTGPGNTIMDAYMRAHFNKAYDNNAAIASKGIVNQDLFNALKNNPFFNLSFPKTVGPELFNLEYLKQAQIKSNTINLSNEDVLATLNLFTASTIAEAIKQVIGKVEDTGNLKALYMSGGGMHNPLLLAHIQELLNGIKVLSLAILGFNPDAKEAILFALLANEAVAGEAMQIGGNATKKPITMGKISFPD